MSTADDSPTGGLCDACVSGVVHTGTPAGTETAIKPFKTVYIARPTGGVKKEAAAIVIFSDIFGFKVRHRPMSSSSRSFKWPKQTGSKLQAGGG
jgi:hypothetical protein